MVLSVGQTLLALVRLCLLCAGSFGVVHVLGVISSVCPSKLREIFPILMLVPGAYLKTKNGNETKALPVLRT